MNNNYFLLEFQLKETTLLGTEYVIDTKTYTLEQILQKGIVSFQNVRIF